MLLLFLKSRLNIFSQRVVAHSLEKKWDPPLTNSLCNFFWYLTIWAWRPSKTSRGCCSAVMPVMDPAMSNLTFFTLNTDIQRRKIGQQAECKEKVTIIFRYGSNHLFEITVVKKGKKFYDLQENFQFHLDNKIFRKSAILHDVTKVKKCAIAELHCLSFVLFDNKSCDTGNLASGLLYWKLQGFRRTQQPKSWQG